MMQGRDFISQGCIEDWMDVTCLSGTLFGLRLSHITRKHVNAAGMDTQE
jgi:hypothetical protein